MFTISNIIFHINNDALKNEYEFFISIKNSLSSNIENRFSKLPIYEGIRLSYYNPKPEELGILIYIIFYGIFNTEFNYRQIYDEIESVMEEFKNKIVETKDKSYSSKIAVKSIELLPKNEILEHLEKYYSRIIEKTKDENYDINVNIDEISKRINESLYRHEYFLKCYRTTKFHEVDIKLWETRQVLACGLSLSAIVMLAVTLEECCKTVLKNDYEQQIRKTQKEANLETLGEASLKAEEKYGDLQLYSLIVALYENKFISEEERKRLLYIKDYIRNAFIHSDKSKIFDARKKSPVQLVKIENNNLVIKETRDLSMLEMSFAQGTMQKKIADENAKIIFYEIEEYIYKISNRFWNRWK